MTLMQRRRALMGAKKGGSRLPAEYQEVEWIKCENNCWIDTGISASATTWLEIFAAVGSATTNVGGIFHCGILANNTTAANKWGHVLAQSSGAYDNYITKNRRLSGNIASFGEADLLFHTFGIDAENGLCWKDDTIKILQFSDTVPAATYHFELGRFTNVYAGVKIGHSKIKNSGLVVFDAYPCYRKTDSIIGMYDTVSETFFTNAGTGTFTKGGNV